MNYRLIHQLPPTENNPRNSEGAFLRGKKGEILFAYSRYHGDSRHDHAPCDIYMITSRDEGESWSEPRPIALAADFGTRNIMSVSAMEHQNGDLAFYFLIKENDRTTTLGRTVSKDGENFVPERCECNFTPGYYVVNNDRLVRLSDGRIVAPAAGLQVQDGKILYGAAVLNFFVSEDDGKTFSQINTGYTTTARVNATHGLQEPGLIEVEDRLYCWMRTKLLCQYEAWSESGLGGFETPQPSQFSSPPSPMQIKKLGDAYYAVYNPVPAYNGVDYHDLPDSWGRTPFTIRKSTDCINFGPLQNIEEDSNRGYSYPALFETKDGCILIGYCRGNSADGDQLCRLGIGKIRMDSLE
ncbi:MAG: exo-alpha-sialidase [Clostridia bacterium]|nr:exo-alpha-sialidase [Clostridia bacterium]